MYAINLSLLYFFLIYTFFFYYIGGSTVELPKNENTEITDIPLEINPVSDNINIDMDAINSGIYIYICIYVCVYMCILMILCMYICIYLCLYILYI
jgi:hypothetical protein